jgi:hypothetical protein
VCVPMVDDGRGMTCRTESGQGYCTRKKIPFWARRRTGSWYTIMTSFIGSNGTTESIFLTWARRYTQDESPFRQGGGLYPVDVWVRVRSAHCTSAPGPSCSKTARRTARNSACRRRNGGPRRTTHAVPGMPRRLAAGRQATAVSRLVCVSSARREMGRNNADADKAIIDHQSSSSLVASLRRNRIEPMMLAEEEEEEAPRGAKKTDAAPGGGALDPRRRDESG